MKVSVKSKPLLLIDTSSTVCFNKFLKFHAKTVLKLNLKISKMVRLPLN